MKKELIIRRKAGIIAFIVSLTLLASVFTACGAKETAGGDTGKVSGTEPTAANSSVDTTNVKEDWKKDTSPATISWFVAEDWYNKIWDTKNNYFDKMVTEDTGISVDISSGNIDKLSALIASDQLPDVVTAWYTYPQVQMLQQSGKLLALDTLAKQYAPNFAIPKSMVDWHGQSDGHLYGFMNYFYAPEKLKPGEALPTHIQIKARKDIMEKLGIKPEDFNTKTGTLDALKKVKAANIKYNGFDISPCYFDLWNLKEMFGARREDEKGNFVDMDYEPETLEAAKFMNELYREGLLAKDVLTLKDEQKQEKVGQGRVFAYTNDLLSYKEIVLYSADNNALFEKVGPIAGAAGKTPYFEPSPMAGWTATMISKTAKQPERIIRFFEYLYSSDEMHLNVQYGPKGIAWNYDENGRVKQTDEFLKAQKEDEAKANLKYGANFTWLLDWIPVMRTMPTPPDPVVKGQNEAVDYFSQHSYNDLAFSTIVPPSSSEEGIIYTKIKDYRDRQFARMIFAKSESEVDTLFNDMKAQENKLGYEKLYAWQNEQFKAAKKKLGIEFAWPGNVKK